MKDFKKSGSFNKKRSFGARPFEKVGERFPATCNECHKRCEVPFRPNGKKPVYCQNCFKGKEEAPAYSVTRSYSKAASTAAPDLTKQFDLLNTKLDRLIKAIEAR